jgi:alpha-mannosidase
MEAFQAESHDGRMGADHSYINIASDNVVLTAMKKTEDGEGLLLRLFEWAGKSGDTEITVPEGAVSAQLTNLMEAPYGNEIQMKNGKLKIPVHPFEIVSVRVNYALPTR